MTLELLEKIFQNIEISLTFEEVKEKALLFYEQARSIKADFGDDYWIQLSKEWDLNITEVWHWETEHQLCLYKVKRDKQGNFVADTLHEFISI